MDWKLFVFWLLAVGACCAMWYWVVHCLVVAAASPVVWIGTQLVSH